MKVSTMLVFGEPCKYRRAETALREFDRGVEGERPTVRDDVC